MFNVSTNRPASSIKSWPYHRRVETRSDRRWSRRHPTVPVKMAIGVHMNINFTMFTHHKNSPRLLFKTNNNYCSQKVKRPLRLESQKLKKNSCKSSHIP